MAYQANITSVDYCILNIRADAAAADAVGSACGLALPLTPNVVINSGHRKIIWAGPDRWIILSGDHGDTALADKINRAAEGLHANATLISDQYTGYVLSGRQSRQVLAQGCALDLENFTVGQSAICTLARTSAIIVPLEGEADYLLLVSASLAGYFEQWFERVVGE